MPPAAILVDLAAALRSQRDEILKAWLLTLTSGKRPSESGLTETDLYNHVAELLDDLSTQMGAFSLQDSGSEALKHAESHGDTRWLQRYQIEHILREIGTLRTTVIDFVVIFTDGHRDVSSVAKRAAHRIVHHFFDGFVVDSASLFAARQQHATLEQERARIAQELHDGVCQHLQGTALLTESLRKRVKGTPHENDVAVIGKLIQEAAEEVRTIAHDVTTLVVEVEGGLDRALANLAKKATALTACSFEGSTTTTVPPGLAVHLYRIAQAALSNSLRHSGATQVIISLEESGGYFVLGVADNGRGYASKEHEFEGMGLHNIRHRAHAIGATVRMESVPNVGTRVICTAPVTPSESTDWR